MIQPNWNRTTLPRINDNQFRIFKNKINPYLKWMKCRATSPTVLAQTFVIQPVLNQEAILQRPLHQQMSSSIAPTKSSASNSIQIVSCVSFSNARIKITSNDWNTRRQFTRNKFNGSHTPSTSASGANEVENDMQKSPMSCIQMTGVGRKTFRICMECNIQHVMGQCFGNTHANASMTKRWNILQWYAVEFPHLDSFQFQCPVFDFMSVPINVDLPCPPFLCNILPFSSLNTKVPITVHAFHSQCFLSNYSTPESFPTYANAARLPLMRVSRARWFWRTGGHQVRCFFFHFADGFASHRFHPGPIFRNL